ncbi:MAG: DUF2510 domain-containing protein [Solirubrobacteraceae bacterium]
MSEATEVWPAAWYPDPWELHEQRFWNGEDWTSYIADRGTARREVPNQDVAEAETMVVRPTGR